MNEVVEPVATGVITGGWPYIIGAYGLTWAGLLAFLTRAVLLGRARPPESP
jgi:hypothetical protein